MPAAKLTKLEKVQYVTLLRAEGAAPRAYYLRYRDPATGKDVRHKLLQCSSRDEARAEARRTNQAVIDQRAEMRTMPAAAVKHIRTAPTLRQAIDEALHARSRRKAISAMHHRNLEKSQEKFLAFMQAEFPAVHQWRDLRRTPHVQAYVDHLADHGLQPVSIRHCLEIISLTANYFADEYEEMGYMPLRVLKIAPELKEPEKRYLTAKQLEHAIATARSANSPVSVLGFALGGWCGLNLMEIARLTRADIDFATGLLTIRESKNRYRSRVIPAPAFVLEVIREHLAGQTVVDIEGSLVLRPPGVAPHYRHLYKPMARILKLAGLKETAAPKDLRKTFINMAIAAGCERECLRRYVGHVPADVMSAHYEAFTADRFRTEVVGKIEAARVASCSEVGKLLAPAKPAMDAAAR